LQHTPFAKATCGTIRLKLLKIGALVRVSVRRIKGAMASVYCGPVLRHPAELMLPAVDLGGRVWLGGRSCKGGPAAPAFGG
jgi:hypothetical protein